MRRIDLRDVPDDVTRRWPRPPKRIGSPCLVRGRQAHRGGPGRTAGSLRGCIHPPGGDGDPPGGRGRCSARGSRSTSASPWSTHRSSPRLRIRRPAPRPRGRRLARGDALFAPAHLDARWFSLCGACPGRGPPSVPPCPPPWTTWPGSRSAAWLLHLCCTACGNCATTSPRTTPPTSPWPNASARRSSPATASCQPLPDLDAGSTPRIGRRAFQGSFQKRSADGMTTARVLAPPKIPPRSLHPAQGRTCLRWFNAPVSLSVTKA